MLTRQKGGFTGPGWSLGRLGLGRLNKADMQKKLKGYARGLRAEWPLTIEQLNTVEMRVKREYIERWEGHVAQGEGVRCFQGDPIGNQWIVRPYLLKPSQMTTELKLRSNTIGTRATMRRDKNSLIPTAQCRKCNSEVENLPHILGNCPSTKGDRIRRHNKIKDLIADRLARTSEVLDEPRIHSEGRLHKPDLVVLTNEDRALVIDVTVRYEKGDYLEEGAREKVRKYGQITDTIKRLFEKREVSVIPIVVGSRGAMPARTREWLTKLGISKADQLTISLMALRHSIAIVNRFIGED